MRFVVVGRDRRLCGGNHERLDEHFSVREAAPDPLLEQLCGIVQAGEPHYAGRHGWALKNVEKVV